MDRSTSDEVKEPRRFGSARQLLADLAHRTTDQWLSDVHLANAHDVDQSPCSCPSGTTIRVRSLTCRTSSSGRRSVFYSWRTLCLSSSSATAYIGITSCSWAQRRHYYWEPMGQALNMRSAISSVGGCAPPAGTYSPSLELQADGIRVATGRIGFGAVSTSTWLMERITRQVGRIGHVPSPPLYAKPHRPQRFSRAQPLQLPRQRRVAVTPPRCAGDLLRNAVGGALRGRGELNDFLQQEHRIMINLDQFDEVLDDLFSV